MVRRMTYLRVKRLRLGAAYERFLVDHLEPSGTIFLLEWTLAWPTTKVAERHEFQHGALGGATVRETRQGSERVADYLGRYGSHRQRWDPLPSDAESPEAEWGFQPALREDVERFAAEQGNRVRRIVFEQPEDLSPLVADLTAIGTPAAAWQRGRCWSSRSSCSSRGGRCAAARCRSGRCSTASRRWRASTATRDAGRLPRPARRPGRRRLEASR